MKVSCEIIRSFDDIKRYEQSWDDLYNNFGTVISQSYHFTISSQIYSINNEKRYSPYFLMFFQRDALVCVMPFLKIENKICKSEGVCTDSDDFDFLIRSENLIKPICKVFRDHSTELGMSVFINNLSSDSGFIKYLQFYNKYSFSYVEDEQIFISLKNSDENELISTKKEKYEKRRILKKKFKFSYSSKIKYFKERN